jgi:hypothetical protein
MGQFDKYIKPGSGGKSTLQLPFVPDIALTGTNPAVKTADESKEITTGGKNEAITTASGLQAGADVARQEQAAVSAQLGQISKRTRKRQLAGLKTTTMRLNEKTGEAYDTEENKPAPSGRVFKRKANPKYLAADVQRQNEEGAARAEADRRNSTYMDDIADMEAGEAAFNARERASGSTLRSEKGVTYDIKQKEAELEVPKPKDITAESVEKRAKEKAARKTQWEADLNSARNIPARETKPSTSVSDSTDTGIEQPYVSPYTPSVTEKEKEASAADQKLVAAGRTAEAKEKTGKNTRKLRSTTISADSQDIYKPDGSLKDEYNDINNNPLSTTTMRLRDKSPLFISKQHKKLFNLKTKATKDLAEKHAKELENADSMSDEDYLATTARHDKERKDLEAALPTPAEGYYNSPKSREMSVVDTGKLNKPSFPIKPKTSRLSARNIANWPTTSDEIHGKSIGELEEEDKATRSRRSPGGLKTTELRLNDITSASRAGKSKERNLVEAAKMSERAEQLGVEGKSITTTEPHILDRAKRLAKRMDSSVNTDDPLFHRSEYVRMATVMHHAGIGEDTTGGTADYDKLKRFAGDHNFKDSVETARQFFDNQKRFNSGKLTTYSTNPGFKEEGINPETDHFRTKSGEKVKLSDMSHPENPLRGGGVLKGSESPFMGFHGDYMSEKGVKPTANGIVGKSPEWHHQGWHPYTDKEGDRVFEYHDVSGATHMADLVKHAITKGRTFNQMTASLKSGATVGFKAGKDAPVYKIGAAPKKVTLKTNEKGEVVHTVKFDEEGKPIKGTEKPVVLTKKIKGETGKTITVYPTKKPRKRKENIQKKTEDRLSNEILDENSEAGKAARAPLAKTVGETLNIRGNNGIRTTTEAELNLASEVKNSPKEGKFVLGGKADAEAARKAFGNTAPKPKNTAPKPKED